MFKKVLLSCLLICISWLAFSQRDQAEYLEAKRLFRQNQFREAKLAFIALSDSEIFGKHAGFYAGLSSYRLGDATMALDHWRQLLVRYPKWEQKREVLFWLALVNMEQGSIERGITYASQHTEETVNVEVEETLLDRFVRPLPVDSIKKIYSIHSNNKLLAGILVRRLNQVSYSERDFLLIDKLISRWGFDLEDISRYDLPDVKKKEYTIAVLFPFLFDSLQNPGLIIQNSFVMDMYQGMLLAAEDLRKEGKEISLLPFDTKRQEEVTRRILQNKRLKETDLIIGPLTPGPNKAVNEFSLANKINTINPISSNAEVIGDNPFSFLFRPSYETMAREMAELAAEENENENVMIYFEQNARDSAFAAVYKEVIESAGFKVVAFRAMDKENAKQVLDTLSAQYDVYLTKEEADSVMLLEGSFVRERRIRSDEIERMQREEGRNKALPDSLRKDNYWLPVSYDDRNNPVVYYGKEYLIKPDSIGHIVGVTQSNLYANNLISALEARSDSIKLYGYGDWLEFTMLSFSQLDRLSVALVYPDFIDKERISYQEVHKRIREKYKTNPSLNHFRGYEIVWFTGTMLHRHGKYFQKGIKGAPFEKGKIFEGYRYDAKNDNQIVPIVRFKDARLEVVNRDNYEDREK